jgi:hypothetical protein
VWIDLAHVCRKWRAAVFGSSFRLDVGVTIGPVKPDRIKKILSGHLPIFIDYKDVDRNFGSALRRMRTALKHRDRVRVISIDGMGTRYDKFLKQTQYAFPVLESLSLRFESFYQPKFPDTFLRGPDLSNLHLRRLRLENISLSSISGLLLSATALTDLFLKLHNASSPSAETSLLACLQGMHCLCSLHLSMFPVAAFNYHGYCPTLKINMFSLCWL